MHRIGQVAAQLDISPSMLRRWSERFAEWLSEEAAHPGLLENGRHAPRAYVKEDIELLKSIKHLLEEGLTDEEIEVHLKHSSEEDPSTLALRDQESRELYVTRTAAAALGQVLHQLRETQQALLNAQKSQRDLLNVVINDAISLEKENERLRKRLRMLEEEMARLKESDWNHRLTLEERVNQLERDSTQKRSWLDRLIGR